MAGRISSQVIGKIHNSQIGNRRLYSGYALFFMAGLLFFYYTMEQAEFAELRWMR